MTTDMSRDQEPLRGERLNDGLSVLAAGTGPPLVILPGFGTGADLSVRVPRSTAWSTVALARGFRRRIHQINRPLDPPAGMTFAALASWHATAFRERFGEPVDVMGISAGGVTALQLELDHPGTIRRLALCSAASRVGPHGLNEMQRLIRAEGQGQSGARIGRGLVGHGPLQLLLLAVFGRSRGQSRAPGEAMLVQAAQSWDVTGRLGEIGVPVLVAGGTRDRVVPPELMQATASGIAGARLLLLPGRDHLTALYDPRLKPAVERFLADPG
jgi:pimeloyl-ACP methyl ester carboxylesterase